MIQYCWICVSPVGMLSASFGIRVILISKRACVKLLLFLLEMFDSDIIWAWGSVCVDVVNNNINYFDRYEAVQTFYFILGKV